MNDIGKSSHSLGHTRKLLRLRLTDGHLWLTIVKYHIPIPTLSMDIPLGTKFSHDVCFLSCFDLQIFCHV
jgi:hypothetical protein